MNKYQAAYAIAKAAKDAASEMYWELVRQDHDLKKWQAEQCERFDAGVPDDDARVLELEQLMMTKEERFKARTRLTECQDALKKAEFELLDWALDHIRHKPDALRITGASLEEIETMFATLKQKTWDVGYRTLVDLCYRLDPKVEVRS